MRREGTIGMTSREAEWSALLRAAMAGDGQCYARFLRLVTPVLRGIVRARGRALGPEGQEDVVQEVLIAIHTKRHTWDTGAPLLPWLYAVTRHKVVDAFRRRGASVHLPIDDFVDVLEAEAVPDSLAARDSAVLIGQLDARSAAIVRAVSLDGQSTAEVGARFDMTEGAVRVALHRAIQRMARLAKGME
jgi:RNA polymerase sigma-70 factor (ECF subfamily)